MRAITLTSAVLTALALASPAAVASAHSEPKLAASGKTQIVAKAGAREITLTELRAEMARLGLSPADPSSERAALDGILNRALLADAARKADLHRRPEAIARIRAAEDQALAEMYLGYASQPAEPTRGEIDDYIRVNSSLFGDRRAYVLSVLTLPTRNFDEAALTPLFDSERDFALLAAHLETAGVVYSIAGAAQSSVAFPKPIREQLARYSVADNIVVKGEAETQIMKILRVRKEASRSEEWPALARSLILEQEAADRAQALLARLKRDAAVAYYRPSAAPLPTKNKK